MSRSFDRQWLSTDYAKQIDGEMGAVECFIECIVYILSQHFYIKLKTKNNFMLKPSFPVIVLNNFSKK